MKLILLSIAILLLSTIANAQEINGNWYGQLNIQGNKIKLVFHINQMNGNYMATMDSPDQGAYGLLVDEVHFNKSEISILAKKYGINFKGNYISDSTLFKGVFTQGSVILPLVLSKDSIFKQDSKAEIKNRPQDPVTFNYRIKEVTFQNKKAGITLSGTLTIPSWTKPSKIVVMITGSGPQNRNEELKPFNHRPFLVWSDYLTNQGVAVLRFDDRGIEKSTGNFSTATTLDFADDVESAVEFIKSDQEVNKLSIGLIGHSEGGMIAPIVASRNKNISFIILLAGPGVPISQLMIKQSNEQERLSNVPSNIAKIDHEGAILVYNFLGKSKGMADDAVKSNLKRILSENYNKYPASALGNMNINDLIEKQSAIYLSPWFRYFVTYQPKEYLTKVKCPVLAMNGTLDSQVSEIENLEAIRKNLTQGGNKMFKIVPLKDLNHLFQKCKTGSVNEYGQIEETVNPVALQTVINWIKQLK